MELGGSRGSESECPVLCDKDIPSPLLHVAGEGHTDFPGLLWLVALW